MPVRPAQKRDLPWLLEIYAPYVARTNYTFEYEAPSREEWEARFEAISARFPYLVYEEAGRVLGYAYGSAPFAWPAYRWCAEASIYLAPEAKRRGIGTLLYGCLEKCLAAQGYQVVYALVTASNLDSLAFHEAMGYRPVGELPACGFKRGVWEGVAWLEKRLCPAAPPGEPPRPWKEMVKSYRFLP